MAERSKIEWTDATVNFWWGCTKVGPGCDNCYAETWSERWGESIWGVGAPRRKIKSARALIHRLDNDYSAWAADYYAWEEHKPKDKRRFGPRMRVFIQSMSDLFDLEVPVEWFREAWELIDICDRLEIQIVTKRISAVEKRLAAIGAKSWPRHAGLMITVVNQQEADRDNPRLIALKKKFNTPWIGISAEPLLGPLDLTPWLHELDWVIVGGESGPNARPMHPDWARSIRDCMTADGSFPVDYRYSGEYQPPPNSGSWWLERVGKKVAGRFLDGVEHNGYPEARPALPASREG